MNMQAIPTRSINKIKLTLARYKIYIAIAILILIAAFGLVKSKQSTSVSSQGIISSQEGSSVAIDKEFDFPIYNKGAKTENSLKLKLTTVEKTDKILVNGKPATAKDGKDFLVMYLEITNPTKDKLNVRPVDFFRLVDSQGNQFAADVHNDPVKAEPIAIKKTRIGFVVDESLNTFKFQVGEINGEKQELEINI